MSIQRIVVKLGTSTLTAGTPRISPPRLVELVRQISILHASGREMLLVSSGAIAAGRERLNFPSLPKAIPVKQMLAAVGQPRLMALYEQLFGLYEITVAQVLLTRADLSNRRRYLNSRNTLAALIDQRALPIVNENDTVATEEIRVGDNDNLSALVTNLVEADLIVLLTDQAGLFTADPRQCPDGAPGSGEIIREVSGTDIPEILWQAAGGSAGGLGTGGMVTKLQAADLARRSGATVVIVDGSAPDVLLRLVRQEELGTRFLPAVSRLEGRKRFILAERKASGKIKVDEGAALALKRGGSLLPVGIVEIAGSFERGDIVSILGPNGSEIARGLSGYASADLERIRGQQSEKIEDILGFIYGDEVIHRNEMVML